MFIVDTNTWYDDDKEMFGCYIGKEDKSLYYTAWGTSPDAATLRANFLAKVLNDITYKKAKSK